MMRRYGATVMALASGTTAASGRAGEDAAVAERVAWVWEIRGATRP